MLDGFNFSCLLCVNYLSQYHQNHCFHLPSGHYGTKKPFGWLFNPRKTSYLNRNFRILYFLVYHLSSGRTAYPPILSKISASNIFLSCTCTWRSCIKQSLATQPAAVYRVLRPCSLCLLHSTLLLLAWASASEIYFPKLESPFSGAV